MPGMTIYCVSAVGIGDMGRGKSPILCLHGRVSECMQGDMLSSVLAATRSEEDMSVVEHILFGRLFLLPIFCPVTNQPSILFTVLTGRCTPSPLRQPVLNLFTFGRICYVGPVLVRGFQMLVPDRIHNENSKHAKVLTQMCLAVLLIINLEKSFGRRQVKVGRLFSCSVVDYSIMQSDISDTNW
jgi:hypothetical protein